MNRRELEDFVELAIEIAADSGMPLTEALFLAMDMIGDLRASFGPVLTIEPVYAAGVALAA